MVNERIKKLRDLMRDRGVDMYYIPTSDYHNSEYVGAHFRERAYMSGFTGSSGVMVITLDAAYLWSDGRYFIQAEEEIKGSEIIFKRQGETGGASPYEFIVSNLQEGSVLAFDGRTVSTLLGKMFEKAVGEHNGKIIYDIDLAGDIWKDRPALEKNPVFLMEVKYVGMDTKEKLSLIRNKMEMYKAKNHLITSLDDIAYILNIRGNDIPATPVVLSYLLIQEQQSFFYVDRDKLSDVIGAYLIENDIIVKPYNAIYEDIKTLSDTILLDGEIVNYTLYKGLNEDIKVLNHENPSIMMKAIKNDVEIENLRIAHIKDGVAVTKFMYWLKQNIGNVAMDEVSVADVLESFRKEQEHFIEISFDTIAAYNANAAMMHYHATDINKSELAPSGMLLVDSGGQYQNGTTDITRTFALGAVDLLWKRDFTLTLCGMSALARAKFLSGCTGINLDILARQPLWNIGIDYRCGTGHGVGFTLGVHEGPHGIRWRKSNRKEDTVLQPGMVVTDEPGVYQEGSHGIRIENELIVEKRELNEYGQFLGFETITFVPIDLDLIDIEYLDRDTRNWLNMYHQEVFKKISPYLDEATTIWLKQYTKAI